MPVPPHVAASWATPIRWPRGVALLMVVVLAGCAAPMESAPPSDRPSPEVIAGQVLVPVTVHLLFEEGANPDDAYDVRLVGDSERDQATAKSTGGTAILYGVSGHHYDAVVGLRPEGHPSGFLAGERPSLTANGERIEVTLRMIAWDKTVGTTGSFPAGAYTAATPESDRTALRPLEFAQDPAFQALYVQHAGELRGTLTWQNAAPGAATLLPAMDWDNGTGAQVFDDAPCATAQCWSAFVFTHDGARGVPAWGAILDPDSPSAGPVSFALEAEARMHPPVYWWDARPS